MIDSLSFHRESNTQLQQGQCPVIVKNNSVHHSLCNLEYTDIIPYSLDCPLIDPLMLHTFYSHFTYSFETDS